jgi:hypothetical protein
VRQSERRKRGKEGEREKQRDGGRERERERGRGRETDVVWMMRDTGPSDVGLL